MEPALPRQLLLQVELYRKENPYNARRVKTPCIIQMENNDCGAVALAIVLAYYNCYVSIDVLRTECGVSRDGTSAQNIIKAAQVYGLKAFIKHSAPNEVPLSIYPIILFWKNRHFVVLEGCKGNTLYLNDPQKGRYSINREIFNEQFSGSSIEFTRTAQFKKIRKEKPILSIIHQIFASAPISILFVILMSVLLTLPALATPLFSKIYIDRYVIQAQDGDLSVFFGVMLLMLGLQTILIFFQQKILRYIECLYTNKLSVTLVKHLLALPTLFFSSRKAADLSLRPQAAQSLAMVMTGPIYAILSGAFQMLIYIIIMLFMSPVLSLVAGIFACAQFLCVLISKDEKKQSSTILHQQMLSITSLTASYIASVFQIKAMGSEQTFFSKWQENLHQYLNTYRKASNIYALSQSVSFLLTMTAYTITMSLGAWLVLGSNITLGELMAFSVILVSFNQSILQFTKLGNQFRLAEVNYRQITDIIQHKTPVSEPPIPLTPQKFQGRIEIIDLTFGYSPLDKPLFDNLNLIIEPGSNTAIVGASGSGKTTLVHLISGLYQPWSGQILIDGVPISSLSPEIRAQTIGVVSQDQFFFNGSIQENICLWDTRYSNTEIMNAVRTACLDEFISQLEEGLNFQITDGATNLSGGQRQRIEIARTLLIKPKVLLLDEATNTLDPLVEQQIDKNIRQQNLTTITIAHRFNSICKADKIYILKQGKIIASGTHQLLSAQKNQAYFQLFNRPESVQGIIQ